MFLNLCEGRAVKTKQTKTTKNNLSMAMPLGLKLARWKDKDVTTATQG